MALEQSFHIRIEETYQTCKVWPEEQLKLLNDIIIRFTIKQNLIVSTVHLSITDTSLSNALLHGNYCVKNITEVSDKNFMWF